MTSLASWELTFNFKHQYIMTEKEMLEQLIDEAIEKELRELQLAYREMELG